MRQIAILGGGISGLAVAWHLQKHSNISLTIFEKESRLGGWIRSSRQGNYFFEAGPRAFRATDSQEALTLIQELGLQSDLISAQAKRRFIFHQGKLEPIPEKILEFFSSPLMKKCFSSLIRDLFVPRSCEPDESVYDFFKRRFSSHLADQWIDPLIKGIYAGDPKKLSMQACFPKLWELERTYRSIIWGAFRQKRKKKTSSHLVTLKGGLETLVLALAERVDHQVLLNCGVEKITFDAHQAYVHCEKGVHSFDTVISTLPSHALAKILDLQEFQTDLQAIPFIDIGIVHLGYRSKVHPFQGFGYLVPEREKQEILGAIFDSAVFPQQNGSSEETRITVMIGGASRPDLLVENQYLRSAQAVIDKHLGITENPEEISGTIARQAIPQYPIGFAAICDRIKQSIPGMRLFLLGTSFCGVSVNQAIASAKHFSESFMSKTC